MSYDANWAVLVAGSDGYGNYRHQADVYHAYQILIGRGIPEENIIVFAKDDIANNSRNPVKGKVFNKPDGEDVYAGVQIDYSGYDVTPENFMNVLKGDKAAMEGIGSGKVLESTANDNVFIFFSDHGSEGLIAFPVGGYLYEPELTETLKFMYENKSYNQLVIYIEACYSGSMFKNLPADWNIYATTAANDHESSWGYYCGSEAHAEGKNLNTCLGDEYSVQWMEHTDSIEDLSTLTVNEQFEIVKERTSKSEVCEFGDVPLSKKHYLSEFQGGQSAALNFLGFASKASNVKGTAVNNINMHLYYLKNLAETSNDQEDIDNYQNELTMTARSALIFDLFKKTLNVSEIDSTKDIDYKCYKKLMKHYEKKCGVNVDRDHQYFNYIASFCTLNKPIKEGIIAFNEICKDL